MKFLRSVLMDARTSATEVYTLDLPINPLSHLIFTVEGLNATDEATYAEIIAFINTIKVTHRGQSIVNLEGEDLAGLNLYLFGSPGFMLHPIATDNLHRAFSLIIPFGRKLFDPNECFPGTRKGELQFEMDMTALATSIDNGIISLEAVELLDASPTQYLKSTLLSVAAPGATGNNDVELPIGNDLLAVIIGMATFPTTSSFAFGVDDFRLLVDNVEHQIASSRAPGLLADMAWKHPVFFRALAAQLAPTPAGYLWADFDPHGDGEYAIKTGDFNSVKARLTMGVDEAINLIPVELVQV